MRLQPVKFTELEIDALKALALVCRRFGNYRTIDRIQKRIYEIEIQVSKITSFGASIPA